VTMGWVLRAPAHAGCELQGHPVGTGVRRMPAAQTQTLHADRADGREREGRLAASPQARRSRCPSRGVVARTARRDGGQRNSRRALLSRSHTAPPGRRSRAVTVEAYESMSNAVPSSATCLEASSVWPLRLERRDRAQTRVMTRARRLPGTRRRIACSPWDPSCRDDRR
jgi:hypothetical protein